jgi:uncharacterized YceG family protein
VPGGRTPEEREAARREREARRAGRGAQQDRAPAGSASAEPITPAVPDWTEGAEPFAAEAPPPPRDRRAELFRGLWRRRPQGPGRPGRGRLVPALVGGLLFVVLTWFLLSLFQPFHGDGEGAVRVVVPKGAGVGEIADLLAEKEVISSGFFFEARATLSGRRGDLKPGSYTLRRDMSLGAALDALAAGPPPNIVTITVPEGRSRREVARIVGDQLEGDYLAASKRSPALDPREYDAKRPRDLEGFLFPATYELRRGRPVEDLVRQQLSAFRRQFDQLDLRYAHSKNLTDYDVLIIASMVEREASLARERPLIASVIYNRLRQGMHLGIDATLRFALDQWERPLSESELASPSPYNTRVSAGLPPGPIGNPGIASIRAAARPTRTRYLYFVVKPGGDGAHAFARTDAEHQRNVERYNRAREALDGQSPD